MCSSQWKPRSGRSNHPCTPTGEINRASGQAHRKNGEPIGRSRGVASATPRSHHVDIESQLVQTMPGLTAIGSGRQHEHAVRRAEALSRLRVWT